ncbi:MAG: fructose-bisphosphate aldolase class I [Rhodospirillales bacterium]|nr:fructose-bisphosphate aldolase class I [Rhodospirillales bacterium]
MNIKELNATAKAMVDGHKGLLAADESTGTCKKRLDSVGVEATETNRRDYRELLFSAKGLGQYISGVILYDETLRQKAKDGTPMGALLKRAGVLPGIKLDAGAKPLAGSPDETVTEGLDGLAQRVEEYVGMGARFAKWRAVIKIGAGIPTPYCLETNAHALARYARICQEGGLVPIVEPEVLMDGDHGIERCDAVTTDTLRIVFDALYRQGVAFEGIILKPNMVISAKACPKQASVDEVADRTIACFRRMVPAAVPGIMFLSGGQSEVDATRHLNAMNAKFPNAPWKLSFSYGRALQDSALKTWRGQAANVAQAQSVLLLRARMNSEACHGAYRGEAA